MVLRALTRLGLPLILASCVCALGCTSESAKDSPDTSSGAVLDQNQQAFCAKNGLTLYSDRAIDERSPDSTRFIPFASLPEGTKFVFDDSDDSALSIPNPDPTSVAPLQLKRVELVQSLCVTASPPSLDVATAPISVANDDDPVVLATVRAETPFMFCQDRTKTIMVKPNREIALSNKEVAINTEKYRSLSSGNSLYIVVQSAGLGKTLGVTHTTCASQSK